MLYQRTNRSDCTPSSSILFRNMIQDHWALYTQRTYRIRRGGWALCTACPQLSPPPSRPQYLYLHQQQGARDDVSWRCDQQGFRQWVIIIRANTESLKMKKLYGASSPPEGKYSSALNDIQRAGCVSAIRRNTKPWQAHTYRDMNSVD